MNKQIGADRFLVDTETGKKIVFYQCDPEKNQHCRKSGCKSLGRGDDMIGCDITTDPEARAAGSQAFYLYCIPGSSVEWSRVYIPPGLSGKRLFIKWSAIILSSALLFLAAKDAALKERGYEAFGGEYVILLLPFIYYVAERIIKDWITHPKERSDKNGL